MKILIEEININKKFNLKYKMKYLINYIKHENMEINYNHYK